MKQIFGKIVLPLLFAVLACCGCTESVQVETGFASTNLPTNGSTVIPYYGGIYQLKFQHQITTKADTVFMKCQYRVNYGNRTGAPVLVDDGMETVDVEILPNNTETYRQVVVETAPVAEGAAWKKVVDARQDPGLMKVGDTYWAKANLTAKDGRYAIAKTNREPGLFFFGCNQYGIPADDRYDGVAYTPARVRVGLDFIAGYTEVNDACTAMDPGLRTPTYAEFKALYDIEDRQSAEDQGIEGVGYRNSSFVLPFHGFFNIKEVYWYNNYLYFGYQGYGWDLAGHSLVYTANRETSTLDYNVEGRNMANLRCVKNTELPSYVSHQLPEKISFEPLEVAVVTAPGSFSKYDVRWEATDGTVAEAMAGKDQPQATMTIPANENVAAGREWHLFVNRIPAGIHFTQPRMKDYLQLVSCTPETAGYEGFRLTVKCKSDRSSFIVQAKSADGVKVEAKGTASQPDVVLSIPFNESQQKRVYTLYLDGKDSGKKVTQAASPKPYDVIWSPGYLKIKGNEYIFAAPDEKGLYFKWNSYYGISFGSASKYPGQAFCPTPVTVAYKDIPSGILDPCTMVKPAGTWRMPQVEEVQDLIGSADPVVVPGVSWTLTDVRTTVCLTAGGRSTDGNLSAAQEVMFWTSSPAGSGKCNALVWPTQKGKKPQFSATSPATAMMVRCVRNR